MSFTELGLAPQLLRAVSRAGYTTPTPIQTQAIPPALEGRDLLGCAQTGTGKTAAFGLPLLQRLSARSGHGPRALILTPTRELAAQIDASLRALGTYLPLRTALIMGGVNFDRQEKALRRGADIVVATPGRLLDHLQRRNLRLDALEIIVLDEADRMLDMGFIQDIRRIIAAAPARRQTLLFSATMPAEIVRFANEMLKEPVRVEVARPATSVSGVTQTAHPVDHARKPSLLVHLLKGDSMRRTLVFTRTKRGADRLTDHLAKNGCAATAIHSNKNQNARTRALQAFRSGGVRVLVATDIASRGIDVQGISHVVNFDLPNTHEDYIHRIGRTARAQATGCAISFVSEMDRDQWRILERSAKPAIVQSVVAGFEPTPGRTGGGPHHRKGRPSSPSKAGRPRHFGRRDTSRSF